MPSIISPDMFAQSMEPFLPMDPGERLAVAVSGGVDSFSLVILLYNWAKQRGHSVTALIVDHGLRRESTHEAGDIASQLQSLGINATILTWVGEKPKTRIQERAREARYHLLLDWCRKHGCQKLFLGHHGDDQQETVLWRLMRGSDLWGLAGMSVSMTRQGIRICRPLLGFRKDQLRATLARLQVRSAEDPSNTNIAFSRVAVRQRRADLPFVPDRLAAHVRHRFEKWRNSFIRDHVFVSCHGYISMEKKIFDILPDTFCEFLLQHLLMVVGGRKWPVRRESITLFLKGLRLDMMGTRTLGGCVIFSRKNILYIAREFRGAERKDLGGIQDDEELVWDQRFRVCAGRDDIPPAFRDFPEIAPLGEKGIHALAHRECRDEIARIPWFARLALPALWSDGHLAFPLHFPPPGTKVEITFSPSTPLFVDPFQIV